MKHTISVSFTVRTGKNFLLSKQIKKYISAALDAQSVGFPAEINVMITDDQTIQAINKANRDIDRSTDVLSFPMFSLMPGDLPEDVAKMTDPATGRVPLGDMAISWEHTKAQAEEYGHSVSRELAYLTVHSVLHLLGYDHMDEAEMKRAMRAREEQILETLNLTRE